MFYFRRPYAALCYLYLEDYFTDKTRNVFKVVYKYVSGRKIFGEGLNLEKICQQYISVFMPV